MPKADTVRLFFNYEKNREPINMPITENSKISLPPELTQQLQEMMKTAGFSSLEDFILYILQDFIDRSQPENTSYAYQLFGRLIESHAARRSGAISWNKGSGDY